MGNKQYQRSSAKGPKDLSPSQIPQKLNINLHNLQLVPQSHTPRAQTHANTQLTHNGAYVGMRGDFQLPQTKNLQSSPSRNGAGAQRFQKNEMSKSSNDLLKGSGPKNLVELLTDEKPAENGGQSGAVLGQINQKSRLAYMTKLGISNDTRTSTLIQSNMMSQQMPQGRSVTAMHIQFNPRGRVISADEELLPRSVLISASNQLAPKSLNTDAAEIANAKLRFDENDEILKGNAGGAEEEESPGGLEGNVTVYDSFATPESEGYSLDFISKNRTNDNIRRNFLSKLTYQKIWLTPLEKPKLHETAIIFDWDDTLLCTSFISPKGYYEHVDLSPQAQQQIKLLEETAAKMLSLAVKSGKTFIITNAAEGWVQFSAQQFMPSVAPILDKITIISARSKYEAHFPRDVTQWKLHAFLETQANIDEAMITNIIALGDSMMEIDAAHHLALKFSKALIKTVKFRENPKPNELVKQLNLVIQKFDEITNSPKNLTIRLEKKQNQA